MGMKTFDYDDLYSRNVVRKSSDGSLHFPECIPESRRGTHLNYCRLCSAFTALIGLFTGGFTFLSWLCIVNLSTFSAYLMYRCFLLVEERKHFPDRIAADLIAETFRFSSWDALLVVMSIVTLAILSFVYGVTATVKETDCAVVAVSIVVSVMAKPKRLLFSTQAFESYQLVDELLVDYASGMAHSFFHGYLNIVLPEKGTDEKGLKELMRDYESSQGIEFAQYKLFVLVPLSMYCPATIEEFAPSIETSRNLPAIERSVAGVCRRSYKNSVYKIKQPGTSKMTYVCAEYATPIRTFRKVVCCNTEYARKLQKHRVELVKKFYLTLIGILNDNIACRDYCEVILFNDKDKFGRPYDVGQFILRRIEEIDKQKYYVD